MTLTFKDSDGVECELAVRLPDRIGFARMYRMATVADLLRALGLSTEGGPTDDELREVYLAGLGHRAAPLVPHNHKGGVRALFAAGAASRQPEVDDLIDKNNTACDLIRERDAMLGERQAEVDRLTAELDAAKGRVLVLEGDVVLLKRSPVSVREQRRAERAEAVCDRLESELAATKEKLAEVERERDRLAEERGIYKAVLSVYDAKGDCPSCKGEGWAIPRSQFDDGVRCAACRGSGLTSAGTDADRTEAPKCEQRAGCRASKHSYRCPEIPPVQDFLPDEPPRPEAGELRCEYCNMREHAYSKGGRCYGSLSRMHSFDEPKLTPDAIASTIVAIADSLPTEEPKPEPQPSGERPHKFEMGGHTCCYCGASLLEGEPGESCGLALPWSFSLHGDIRDAKGRHLATVGAARARFIIERCNAPEPSASVGRDRGTDADQTEASATERQPEVKRNDGSEQE